MINLFLCFDMFAPLFIQSLKFSIFVQGYDKWNRCWQKRNNWISWISQHDAETKGLCWKRGWNSWGIPVGCKNIFILILANSKISPLEFLMLTAQVVFPRLNWEKSSPLWGSGSRWRRWRSSLARARLTSKGWSPTTRSAKLWPSSFQTQQTSHFSSISSIEYVIEEFPYKYLMFSANNRFHLECILWLSRYKYSFWMMCVRVRIRYLCIIYKSQMSIKFCNKSINLSFWLVLSIWPWWQSRVQVQSPSTKSPRVKQGSPCLDSGLSKTFGPKATH